MRRKEKEIKDPAEIERIISRASVCRLAMVDGEKPYIVPLCFGYSRGKFYFHSALEGRKIEILKKKPAVCFELDIDVEIVKGKEACKWGLHYKSVIGHGEALFVSDPAEKRAALDIIMAHYAGERKEAYSYPESTLEKTAVIRVDVMQMRAKKS